MTSVWPDSVDELHSLRRRVDVSSAIQPKLTGALVAAAWLALDLTIERNVDSDSHEVSTRPFLCPIMKDTATDYTRW